MSHTIIIILTTTAPISENANTKVWMNRFKRHHFIYVSQLSQHIAFGNIINSLRVLTFSTASLLIDISWSLHVIGKIPCLLITFLRYILCLPVGLNYFICCQS